MKGSARNILILGGTQYFGKLLAHKLLANGDNVCIVTRGNNPIPVGCSFVKFDRNEHDRFESCRYWDVVYDQSCYQSGSLKNLDAVISRCETYILTSSQAVYPPGLTLANESMPYYCLNGSKINSYGKEKCLAELYVIKHNNHCIFPRFPVVVGVNDPLKRLQVLIKKISTGSIDLPKCNPLLQIVDESDAASVLYQLPFTKLNGPINIASKEILSAESLCYSLAKITNVQLKINWLDSYSFTDFDLIKGDSKTLDLTLQDKLAFNLKTIDVILKSVYSNFYLSNNKVNRDLS